ncbi:MAG: glycosyltransferase, partial [Candidatus Hydrogenedentes bacterium]|nr:glycosyltransferase [Candidatus Hydrogenedentota bacterium]
QGGAFVGEARRLGSYVHVLDGYGGWDFSLRRKLQRIFRNHRPDVMHSFLFGFDLAAARAARETKVPVVISSRRQLATWKKPRHIRLQKRANALVDCVVANSQAAAQFAIDQENAEPSLFRVIPNGIRADDFVSRTDDHHLRVRFDIPFHTHVIGILANFSPVKDHRLFLDMARELMGRRADVHFLMVGTGPCRKEIQRTIRARGWGDRFTRIASVEEVPDLLRVMSVSVLCSQVEGFPNAVMESMASGTPVVAAAVGGVPELIEDRVTGRLVHTRNPADFADAVDWMIEHHEERQAMADRAALHVRTHLSLHAMIGAYRNLYNELLAKAFRAGA